MSEKIKEYNIVSFDNLNETIDAVNRRISEGWQPFGVIILNYDKNNSERFTQTLVRYDSWC